jgi:hypothetical protein
MMPDVTPTFHGEGLIQSMMREYQRTTIPKGTAIIAIEQPRLISEEYRALNAQLHADNLAYGVGGAKHAPTVIKLTEELKTQSVLDYGAGKGYLARELPFPIWEYDPAIPGKDAAPRPADLVICTDVLEHIEPDHLLAVLDDLRRCTRRVGYFVIHMGPSGKTLADGRNAHLIQKPAHWWKTKLEKFFTVGNIITATPLIHVVVSPKSAKRPVRTVKAT